jgi:hypothetical protein
MLRMSVLPMIDKIIIINDAGIPLYEWSGSKQTEDGSLLSGFLAALNTYAQRDRGEQITKITLDPTTFLFRREKDLVFTILTKDPELEKIIVLILDAVKERFLRQFGKELDGIVGSSSKFKSFDQQLQEILDSYGYFDYEKVKLSLPSDRTYRSFLVFGRQTGEPLYVNAKEYIPRKPLGFQVPIVIKAAERLVSSALGEQVRDICILSTKMRCLSLRSTPSVQIVRESVVGEIGQQDSNEVSERTLKKVLKKPDLFTSSIKDPFIVIDESGGIQVANEEGRTLGKIITPADCIALWQSSKNIFSEVYKELAWASFLVASRGIYSVFAVNSHVVLLKMPAMAELDTFSAMRRVRAFCESLNSLSNGKK